jgi:hypothetical protein
MTWAGELLCVLATHCSGKADYDDAVEAQELTLLPSQSAYATVTFPNPNIIGPGVCSAPAAKMRIYPPGKRRCPLSLRPRLPTALGSASRLLLRLRSEPGRVNASVGICFMPVTDKKTVKNRVHLDLAPDPDEQDAEIERILAVGARRADIGQTGAESWTVLADPEGNEFCVLRPKRTLIG